MDNCVGDDEEAWEELQRGQRQEQGAAPHRQSGPGTISKHFIIFVLSLALKNKRTNNIPEPPEWIKDYKKMNIYWINNEWLNKLPDDRKIA